MRYADLKQGRYYEIQGQGILFLKTLYRFGAFFHQSENSTQAVHFVPPSNEAEILREVTPWPVTYEYIYRGATHLQALEVDETMYDDLHYVKDASIWTDGMGPCITLVMTGRVLFGTKRGLYNVLFHSFSLTASGSEVVASFLFKYSQRGLPALNEFSTCSFYVVGGNETSAEKALGIVSALKEQSLPVAGTHLTTGESERGLTKAVLVSPQGQVYCAIYDSKEDLFVKSFDYQELERKAVLKKKRAECKYVFNRIQGELEEVLEDRGKQINGMESNQRFYDDVVVVEVKKLGAIIATLLRELAEATGLEPYFKAARNLGRDIDEGSRHLRECMLRLQPMEGYEAPAFKITSALVAKQDPPPPSFGDFTTGGSMTSGFTPGSFTTFTPGSFTPGGFTMGFGRPGTSGNNSFTTPRTMSSNPSNRQTKGPPKGDSNMDETQDF